MADRSSEVPPVSGQDLGHRRKGGAVENHPDGRHRHFGPAGGSIGDISCLAFRRRHMRVKLCSRCPYTPHDLADHYDPAAALYACARCDGEVGILNTTNSCEAQRRQPCTTTLHSISMTPPSAAPFAKAALVLSAITPGELPSVQKSASIASGLAGRATTDGCADFAPPDDRHREASRLSGGIAFQRREPAE
jgi:hypothetical protein